MDIWTIFCKDFCQVYFIDCIPCLLSAYFQTNYVFLDLRWSDLLHTFCHWFEWNLDRIVGRFVDNILSTCFYPNLLWCFPQTQGPIFCMISRQTDNAHVWMWLTFTGVEHPGCNGYAIHLVTHRVVRLIPARMTAGDQTLGSSVPSVWLCLRHFCRQ